MNWFLSIAIGWTILLAAAPVRAAESPFVESLAKKQWGDAVKEVEWATSACVSECFPGTEVYRVRLEKPATPLFGPFTRWTTIALRDRDATFLEEEADAAAYFSRSKLKVKNARDATVAARAFANLCGYQVVWGPPGGVAKPPATDWRVTVASTPAGWSVHYTVLTHPDRKLCTRYTVTVSRDGKVSVTGARVVHGSKYLYE
jgi:hypothetical protein